jgi:ATP-binding cassette subfamily B protein
MLLPYLWEYKRRVVIALVFLVAAKLANVGVPLVLKDIVDGLDASKAVLVLPLALLVAYGALRMSTVLFAELRDVVFMPVTQRAARRIALAVFRHLHALSLRFHLDRQTGGMSRDIERGTRGISTLLSFMLFSIIPVVLEFVLVAAVLFAKFDWRFVAVTFAAVIVYIAFTIGITEWRTAIRKRANELDSKANTRAIDSLLNYETVKYFNNEDFEARRYDDSLQRYEVMAVRNEASLGLLNVGQAAIIAVAATALMVLCAQGVVARELSIGDLVLVNGLLIQLYIPLNFLGMARSSRRWSTWSACSACSSSTARSMTRRMRLICPRGRRRCALNPSSSAMTRGGRSCTACHLKSRPQRKWRWSVPVAPANRRWRVCYIVFTMSPAARSASAALICAS